MNDLQRINIFFHSYISQSFLKVYSYSSAEEIHSNHPVAATIGIFDGCHLGHREIFKELTNHAHACSCPAAIFTFTSVDHKPRYRQINNTRIQHRHFDELGIDELHTIPLYSGIAHLQAEEFLKEILMNQLKVKAIVLGKDARLGRNRATSAEDFIDLAQSFGLHSSCIPLLSPQSTIISSSRIRMLIEKGDVPKAEELLGYEYRLGGIVVRDRQKGREIGFPTANIPLYDTQYPPHGVYRCTIILDPENHRVGHRAIAYIGTRPTLLPHSADAVLEVHIPGWDGDLYDQYIEVRSLDFLRSEMKFKSVDELKEQISIDLAVPPKKN